MSMDGEGMTGGRPVISRMSGGHLARSSSASSAKHSRGKLGAWRAVVSSPSADRSQAPAGSARPSMDERSYQAFQDAVLSTIRRDAVELAARWEAQIKNVALMDETRALDD